jgi:hypothetical protein
LTAVLSGPNYDEKSQKWLGNLSSISLWYAMHNKFV